MNRAVAGAGFAAVLVGVLAAAFAGLPRVLCLPADGRFELRYLHSVERSPVVERYRVAPDGTVWLEGMRFRSVGWGLPSDGFMRRGSWFETTSPPRRLRALVLRVSHAARQELRAGGHALALRDVAREGALLRLVAGRAAGCPQALVVQANR
ncbi:MAG: DUF1850 domain-containing protein [Armatimonadota bacterium]|nr:DUF1850 domain-containing protein [Armatimonadota bacterium]MDW8156545.1 DUF1850 domain-containing protein [Armatimonadota bacterium]